MRNFFFFFFGVVLCVGEGLGCWWSSEIPDMKAFWQIFLNSLGSSPSVILKYSEKLFDCLVRHLVLCNVQPYLRALRYPFWTQELLKVCLGYDCVLLSRAYLKVLARRVLIKPDSLVACSLAFAYLLCWKKSRLEVPPWIFNNIGTVSAYLGTKVLNFSIPPL